MYLYRYNKNGNSKLIPIIMQREIVDFIYFFFKKNLIMFISKTLCLNPEKMPKSKYRNKENNRKIWKNMKKNRRYMKQTFYQEMYTVNKTT